MRFDEVENILEEEIKTPKFLRFFYSKWKNHPVPHVVVLDPHYCWNHGVKKDDVDDILAYNVDLSDNRKQARKNIKEIMEFASMLDKNSQDVYKRIKEFYPDSLKYIRRYKRDGVKFLRVKDGHFWKKISIDEL